MKVKVECCWLDGRDKFNFRASLPNGKRVYSDKCDGIWTRAIASRMLDLIEMHGYERKSIRFDHW